jgi:hypothetical protein
MSIAMKLELNMAKDRRTGGQKPGKPGENDPTQQPRPTPNPDPDEKANTSLEG